MSASRPSSSWSKAARNDFAGNHLRGGALLQCSIRCPEFRKMSAQRKSWPELMIDTWLLGAEAGAVIWLRSARIMLGGEAARFEVERMVSEKVAANLALMPKLMGSRSAQAMAARTLAHYRKPVAANRRRLAANPAD
jgi:hypothetical protein